MLVSFKNRCVISFVVFVAIISSYNVSAAPKTWTKDESGRVLVYRAEPSKAVGVIFGVMTVVGSIISSVGFLPGISPCDRLPTIAACGMIGSVISIPSAIAFKYLYYDEYNALYKPLIVIDKYGITYEGHAKILWKNICGYRQVQIVVYNGAGAVSCGYYLEITTDVDRLEIREDKTAVTCQKLYQLIDEGYKSYQESEKENLVAIT